MCTKAGSPLELPLLIFMSGLMANFVLKMQDDSAETANKRRGESQYTLKLKARQASCQVPGCTIELPKKAYHQRYRICQTHAGMQQMVLDGLHVRFCQHCGRFQALQEFDGPYKSCRKSLQRHRKSQSRRVRTKSAVKASSESPSEDMSGGVPSRHHGRSMEPSGSSGTRCSDGNNSDSQGMSAERDGVRLGGGLRRTSITPAPALPSAFGYGQSMMDPAVSASADMGAAALDLLQLPLDEGPSDWIPDLIGDMSLDANIFAPPQLPSIPQLPFAAASAMNGFPRHHRSTRAEGSSGAVVAMDLAVECTLDAALNLLNFELPQHSPVDSGSVIVRASLKLFDTTPDNLPDSVRIALHDVLASSSTFLMHNARPGCVHITAEILMTATEAEALRARGAAGLLNGTLAQGAALMPRELLHGGSHAAVLAQLGNQVAALGTTGAMACVSIEPGSPTASTLKAVVPLAMTPESAQPLILLGRSIAGNQDMVVCRSGLCTPDLAVLSSGSAERLGAVGPLASHSYTGRGLAAGEYVHFSLMKYEEGLHNVEIQKGSLLSSSMSFLVISDNAVVAEIRQLEADSTGVEDVPAFVQGVGVVLEHLRLKREHPEDPNASPAVAARIASLAARIITTAAARRWPALLRLMAPAARAEDVEAAVAGMTMGNQLTLLHIVAGSGCVPLVEALAEWAQETGHTWRCEPAGRSGITPLHVAAVLDDGAAMAAALTKMFGEEGLRAWYEARGVDGLTPAQVAKVGCNDAVLDFLGMHVPQTRMIFHEEEDSPMPIAGGDSGKPAMKGGAEEEEESCGDEWPYNSLAASQQMVRISQRSAELWWKYRAGAMMSAATAATALAVRLFCGGVQ